MGGLGERPQRKKERKSASGACKSGVWVFLIWGGNCNNGLLVGAAFNVNEPFSHSNWNIGPSPAYLHMGHINKMLLRVLPRWTLKRATAYADQGEIKPAIC